MHSSELLRNSEARPPNHELDAVSDENSRGKVQNVVANRGVGVASLRYPYPEEIGIWVLKFSGKRPNVGRLRNEQSPPGQRMLFVQCWFIL